MKTVKDMIEMRVFERRAVQHPFAACLYSVKETESPVPYDIQHRHRVELLIGSEFFCREGEEAAYMKKQTVKQILSFIYKDIEQDLYELLKDIYALGDQSCIERIQSIMEKIR